MSSAAELSVLFVCLGNICRSPTAHGVFQHLLIEQGLHRRVMVDSAGTGAYHCGKPPDSRSTQVASMRGYDLSALRARQVCREDFYRFDFVLAMDLDNLENLQQIRPGNSKATLGLFLDYAGDESPREVPDPYYGGARGFDHVLDLVESASEGLIGEIKRRFEL